MKSMILAAVVAIAPSLAWAEPAQLARFVPNTPAAENISASRRVIVHVIEPVAQALSRNLPTRQANAMRISEHEDSAGGASGFSISFASRR